MHGCVFLLFQFLSDHTEMLTYYVCNDQVSCVVCHYERTSFVLFAGHLSANLTVIFSVLVTRFGSVGCLEVLLVSPNSYSNIPVKLNSR